MSFGQHFGPILGLSWPIVLARSTQILVGATDVLFVGHLGEASLAATTGGALNLWMLLVLPIGLVSIVSVFASQYMGANDPNGARRFGLYGLLVAALTQLIFFALLPLLPWALSKLSYEPHLIALMADYIQLRLYSAGAAVGLEALSHYYYGLSNTKLPMLAAVSALVLNILGNWLLIDGRLGLPALGVKGAALASTIATSITFVGLLAVFLREGAPRLFGDEMRSVLRLGFPLGLNSFVDIFAFTFFVNVVVAKFGTTEVAAMMTVSQITMVTTLPSFAFASATAVLVGQKIGARDHDEAPQIMKASLLMSMAWHLVLGVMYASFAPQIINVFIGDSPDVEGIIEVGSLLLMFSVTWVLFEVIAATYSEALWAAGDTVGTFWVRLGMLVLVLVPGSWLLTYQLQVGFTAVLVAFSMYAVIVVWLLQSRFSRGAWRHIRLTKVSLYSNVEASPEALPMNKGMAHDTPC